MKSKNDHDHHKGQEPQTPSKQAYFNPALFCRVNNEEPKQHLPYVRMGKTIYYLRSCSDIASQN